ncbi:sensor histidine kinase [Pseudogracilibacillus auburnensis]|uniref:sensor histidine kinase n=1 Tax=Pseudogracilibacillus auburnensis TaxID=1494959 RepID=UPI001A95E98F|nr:HAMP domain-containing sensor histidine kinase [Pseudogracilibacillus auburnensis]MBO1002827.1 HAMP domain-containing histidine kinase [Pseudogracilibacillus auburnensis]
MKIKTWLLTSFLVVMILPLISAYILFAWITSYHNDKKVEEYYEVYAEIQQLNTRLRDPELYTFSASKDELEEMVSEQLSITLFDNRGRVLYTSNPPAPLKGDEVYKNLFELQQGLRAFTYKEPILEDGNIIGLFEVKVARDELISTIVKRGWIVTSIFLISFIIIYLTVALIVNNRLNKRLVGLMDEMSAFASGNSYVETEAGKDEIGELKQHFYAMRKQINAAQEVIELEQKAKEYMVATISHDLKTPLTSIKAYAESLNHPGNLTDEDEKVYRKVIIEKADFMKQMLDDLITHTLLQSQNYELDLVTVDGEEFFDMLISGYEALCEKKNIELKTCNNVIGDYDVNPKQLMRVADNLMMNAIRHTPESGRIWVLSLSKEKELEHWLFDFVKPYSFDYESYTYLIVQNEGEGIPEEKMDFLFDPLYQVDQARSKKDAHGTGLGLSITKQIIEKHDGSVQAFSKINIGACFICSIPKRRGN